MTKKINFELKINNLSEEEEVILLKQYELTDLKGNFVKTVQIRVSDALIICSIFYLFLIQMSESVFCGQTASSFGIIKN